MNPDTYSVDHRYRTSPQSDKVVILYSQIGAPNFSVFHEKLKDLAGSKGFTYILRHYLKVSLIHNNGYCNSYVSFRFSFFHIHFVGQGRTKCTFIRIRCRAANEIDRI